MKPCDLVLSWVEALNRADADALAECYAEGATSDHVAGTRVHGRAAIRDMLPSGFAVAKMMYIEQNPFEDGEWAILE